MEFLELHRPKEYLHQWAFVKLETEEEAQRAMEVRCPWLRLRPARDVWWRNHLACPLGQPAAACHGIIPWFKSIEEFGVHLLLGAWA